MRSFLLLIPIALGVSTLSAQRTPEQRQAREVKDANAHLSEHLQADWTQRALNGDPSAYGGQAARQDRIDLNMRLVYSRWLMQQRRDSTGVWYSVGVRRASLRSLHRNSTPGATLKAGQAHVLTVATPKGGPAKPLMFRTSIATGEAQDGWSQGSTVTADQSGRYSIAVPAMSAGSYDLQISIYDPEHPDTPLSQSKSALVVK